MIEAERFVFNDVDLTDLLRVNPVKMMAPSVGVTSESIPGRPGEVFVRADLEPLTIEVDVRLRLTETDHVKVAEMRRKIAGALITPTPRKLFLPDEPWLYYMALFTGSDELDTLWHTGGTTLEFTCYDPVAFGREREMQLAEGENDLVIGGTWETWPEWELECAGQYASPIYDVEVSDGDHAMIIDGVSGGETVVVDAESHIASASGAQRFFGPYSVPFALKPGPATITLKRATGTLRYRERWV